VQGPEFVRSPDARRRYWARSALGWDRLRLAEPNRGHLALASLEKAGVVTGVVTQNVDRLHHKAGSRNVTELHGALADVHCLTCRAVEDRDSVQARILAQNPGWTTDRAGETAPDGDADLAAGRLEGFVVPACRGCGGVLKPRVVFFGENVPRTTVEEAFVALDAGDLLLVVGSSLAVYSGYRFLRRAVERKIPVAIVNRGRVRGEEHAAVKIEASTGAALGALADAYLAGDLMPRPCST
jgi:NAD-dependent SIR2 family protein deacetylase